jgi:hypothetical protein
MVSDNSLCRIIHIGACCDWLCFAELNGENNEPTHLRDL